MESKVKAAQAFVIVLVASVIGAVISGAVLQQLFAWFIVPFFPSMAILDQGGLVAYIGIAFVVGVMTRADTSHLSKEKRDTLSEITARAISSTIFKPLMYLVYGWVLHLFM